LGGILHLPDALERHPSHGIVIYNRVSSYTQAGRGMAKLAEKTDAVVREVREAAAGKLRRVPFFGVEEGKLSKPRPKLVEAAEYAAAGRRGPIITARNSLTPHQHADPRFGKDAAAEGWDEALGVELGGDGTARSAR
jgi:hypothetical protein